MNKLIQKIQKLNECNCGNKINLKSKYCASCAAINRWILIKLPTNKCLDCKILISKYAKRCKSCASKMLHKLGKIKYTQRTFYYCQNCNKELINDRAKRCRKCNISYLSGQNHWNYKHGNGYLPYPKQFNKKLKLKILKRDNYICQLCNKKGNTIHHIDYDKFNNKNSNLITLCLKCNIHSNIDKDYYFSYFTHIIKNDKN